MFDTPLHYQKKLPFKVTKNVIFELDEAMTHHNEKFELVGKVRGKHPFLSLSLKGNLTVKAGYSWDGMSVPVIFKPMMVLVLPERKRMIASLVHDALYELIRHGMLSSENRAFADILLAELMIQAGAPKWITRIFYNSVKRFGGRFVLPSAIRKTHRAP